MRITLPNEDAAILEGRRIIMTTILIVYFDLPCCSRGYAMAAQP
jgi:hypothetical protein